MSRTAPDSRQLSLSFDSVAPPRGNRALAIGHDTVHYTLRRSRRRTIGFTIDDRGLTISAPRWITRREIEAAIVEKRRWIATRLAQWRDWRAREPLPQLHFGDGGALPYLGRTLTLRLRADAGATRLADEATLVLALPAAAAEAQVRDLVQAWLRAEAGRVLGERIERLATRMAGPPRAWSLSSARSQWGSCTHDGHIRLNWRLVHFSHAVIDYVIAHELAHLHEMNHGPRFWRKLGELLPGFEAAREVIREIDLAAMPI